MTNLIIKPQGNHDFKKTSYFETINGEEFSIDKENSIGLLAIILEALGMDPSEMSGILDKLEDSFFK